MPPPRRTLPPLQRFRPAALHAMGSLHHGLTPAPTPPPPSLPFPPPLPFRPFQLLHLPCLFLSQVIELSTPLLNIQTIMLKLGYPETHPVLLRNLDSIPPSFTTQTPHYIYSLKVPSLCIKLFTAAFILMRVIYLPFVTYGLAFDSELNPGDV